VTAHAAPDEFEAHRARLLGLGYRMLGSRTEAEDLVQETWLRWHRTSRHEIRDAGPWLRTTMTRLCIDELRARKARGDTYVGPWLPEPWPTDAPAADAGERALEIADDLSVAFLLLLERLGPDERAAFLLHDVFDADYADIASALGKTEAAVRQIVSRARTRVADERPRFRPTIEQQRDLADRFQRAVVSRDEASLFALLRADATLISDGGGKALAALRPIYGAEKIVRFFMGITRQDDASRYRLEPCWLNGAAGFVIHQPDGGIYATFTIEVDDDRIARVFAVRNPDKLRHVESGTLH
jgi:RNA polymerase sigma-70 factor (ECF subfamily)